MDKVGEPLDVAGPALMQPSEVAGRATGPRIFIDHGMIDYPACNRGDR